MTRTRLLDGITILAATSALTLMCLFMWKQWGPAGNQQDRSDQSIENWRDFALEGHRVGPLDAAVTIVTFVDYQCPACRGFEPRLRLVLDRFPEDVAVVYRHWPLPQHAAAYVAARATECAALQDAFHPFHEFLYSNSDWMVEPRATFILAARAMGLADLEGFHECIISLEPVPAIEEDIQAAIALGGVGTPTILLNDVRLGRTPTEERLTELVHAQLASKR